MHSAPCRVEDSLQSLGYFPQKVHPPFLPLPNNDIHSHQNGLSCPARSRDGNDVIIQIITAGGQGDKDLKILKRLAADVESLQSDNHVLPMLEEFAFQDIAFGIFPRIAVSLDKLAQKFS